MVPTAGVGLNALSPTDMQRSGALRGSIPGVWGSFPWLFRGLPRVAYLILETASRVELIAVLMDEMASERAHARPPMLIFRATGAQLPGPTAAQNPRCPKGNGRRDRPPGPRRGTMIKKQ